MIDNKKLLTIFLSISLFTSLFIIFLDSAKADEDTFIVWVCSDVEAWDYGAGAPPYGKDWWDAINDTVDFDLDFDVCIITGDLIDYPTAYSYQMWRDWRNESSKDREYFYVMPGNHECQGWSYIPSGENFISMWNKNIDPKGENPATSFVNNSNRPFVITNNTGDYGQIRYEVKMHNIVFLLMGPDLIGHTNTTGNYYPWIDWWEKRLDNNTENIVVCATHHMLHGLGLTETAYVSESSSYIDYLNNDLTMKVSLWLSGHVHYSSSNTRFVDNETLIATDNINMNQLDASAVTRYPGGESHSYFITFTNGSAVATIGDYRHDINSWDASGNPGNITINLSTPFIMGNQREDVITFTSINQRSNNSSVQESYRFFNWTKDNESVNYSIRISNTSNFDDIFLQLDNITIFNGWCNNTFLNTSASSSPYEYNYWENETHCFFYLPYCYNITDYGYDYYQVRSYTT